MKTAAAGVHKTEQGGVALDLRDRDAVREAATRIGLPVLVQPFLHGGVEMLVGAFQDPVFGPLVALGPGGTMAGADRRRRLPLGAADRHRRGRARAKWKGRPPH